MMIKLIHQSNLDEREEATCHSRLAWKLTVSCCLVGIYVGSVVMNAGAIHYQPFLIPDYRSIFFLSGTGLIITIDRSDYEVCWLQQAF